jgi:hypothetical protein
MSVGSFVEPADLRRFRYHLQEKHIVEVNEQNLEQYASLFKRRFNIDLVGLIAEKQATEEAEAKAAEEVVKAEAEAKAVLANRMEQIPRHIALELFTFAEDASIEVVEQVVAEAEAKAAEEAAKAEAEAKAAEEAAKAEAEVKAAEEAAKAEAEAKAAEEAAKPKATAKTTAKAVTTKTE